MNNKERLEEIKNDSVDASYTAYGDGGRDTYRVEKIELFTEDYEWLIEQAERVQELEEELYGNDIQMGYKRMYGACNRDYAKLLQQNKRYREVINNINEKAMLYGVDEQVFEAIKEAIRVLEGESE